MVGRDRGLARRSPGGSTYSRILFSVSQCNSYSRQAARLLSSPPRTRGRISLQSFIFVYTQSPLPNPGKASIGANQNEGATFSVRRSVPAGRYGFRLPSTAAERSESRSTSATAKSQQIGSAKPCFSSCRISADNSQEPIGDPRTRSGLITEVGEKHRRQFSMLRFKRQDRPKEASQ
jgi:hypothetical protein